MLQPKFAENIKTHVSHSISFFPPKNHAVYEIMWKNTVNPEATDDNMAHAHCMLDT